MEGSMSPQEDPDTVVEFPKAPKRGPSSFEKIWGKSVASHGFVAVPAILVRAQQRLGLNSTQMNIIVQLLDYWRRADFMPWPSKQLLADRLGVGPKAIQVNMRALERVGLLRRETRKTASGDFDSNIYHLDLLVERLKALEPEFQAAREDREKATRSAREAEIPAGRRAARVRGGRGR
jgi:hypothetical protein